MLLVLLLMISTVAYGQNPDQPVPAQNLIGGSDAPRNANGYHVALEAYSPYYDQWFFWCSGIIIGSYTILTADHCIDTGSTEVRFRALVNEYDLGNTTGDIYYVEKVKRRSKSKKQIFHHDVGLVKTVKQLPTEYIIQLPDKNEDFTGQTCKAAGWGLTQYFPIVIPRILQSAEGIIMSLEECRAIWTASNKLPDFLVTKRSICFGGGPDGTISLCRGDSGSPLVCDGKLAGVQSWSGYYCQPELPSVYMSVSKALGWIQAHHFG